MAASLDWEPAPEGVKVFWKGLELKKIVPMSEEEQHASSRQLPKQVVRIWFLALGVFLFFCLSLSVVRHRIDYFGLLVFLIIVAASLAIKALVGVFGQKTHNKAVFEGVYVPDGPHDQLLKLNKKLGLDNQILSVEILRRGVIWSVNNQSVGPINTQREPSYFALLRSDSPNNLSEAEKYELKMNGLALMKNQGVALHLLIIPLTHALNLLTKDDRPLLLRLGYALVVFLIYSLFVGQWISKERKLKADVNEGVLETVGNQTILKHSRKVWTKDGMPTGWRTKGIDPKAVVKLVAEAARG